MGRLKAKLLYGSALPLMIGVGVAITGEAVTVRPGAAAEVAANPCAAKNPCAANPCAAANPCGAANPCAAKNPCGAANPCAANPCAANPCAANPCAANPCAANPCAANPCAAKNPCAANPCGATTPCGAANPCTPCNPCAAGGAALETDCVVPRLAQARPNPCAARNPCAANPCGAANPCTANPCAAKNPCGAANPCAANPCAAKNPCGAANPCAANPCAAKNPCAANPCGAANPCAPQANAELTAAEAGGVYRCLAKHLKAGYGRSGRAAATAHFDWARYNTVPYISVTHGGRYVNNYANAAAKAYRKFEKAGVMPTGAVLAKNSFTVNAKGHAVPGPLFVMEKMGTGFNAASGDWRYTMIMPDGKIYGVTGGRGSANVGFCAECHGAVGDTQDHLYFLPEDYRASL